MRKVYEDVCCKGGKRTKDAGKGSTRRENFKNSKLRKRENDVEEIKSSPVKEEVHIKGEADISSNLEKRENSADLYEEIGKLSHKRIKVEDTEETLKKEVSVDTFCTEEPYSANQTS